ncbi:MAG TPA: hypothetical protein VNV65_12390 [Candidatus Solibacter sp.]|jgi:uncharacterized membrane protein YheB (UPF0754 family)|nr:hypothetical protein [Candidatus Solibacter sp.]
MSGELIKVLTIPLFTGVIGYITNWTGVLMLFYPVRFRGWRIPGLAFLVSLAPRKIQEIPGMMHGGLGWQGIVPSRAAKMGSLAVDTGLAKVGKPADFYRQLEPEKLAEHILATAHRDVRLAVERIMQREDPTLWRNLPHFVRESIHARVQEQLPSMVRSVTEQIGENIDQLLDVKLMVIRHIEADPNLANRMFLEVGAKELKFIQNFGFFFGLLLGIPMIFITRAFPQWWVLPIGGVVIGYVTNLLALRMIYEPVQPHKIWRFTVQGLFIKRQPEAAEVYAKIIADDVITLQHIGNELLFGPRSDRTRMMIETALRPAVDQAVGRSRSLVRAALGSREYEAIRASVAVEAVDFTMGPLTDPVFNARQSSKIRDLVAGRMRQLPPADWSLLLRNVTEQDEWLLLLHGAVLGFGAGLVHLAIFG